MSPANILNLWRPSGGWRLEEGIAYGDAPRQRLDVYRPAHARIAPAVVFFYGGSWQGGSRSLYRFLGGSLASRGIVAIVADYRVYPDACFPGFLEDAAQAVGFAKTHAAAWGADPMRLMLMGHSAGAHIAAMLSFDEQWLAPLGLDPRRDLAGLIGLAGPYDFLPMHDRTLKTIFGGNRPETQPINFVRGGERPSLLITPRWDPVVSPGNTYRLAAALRAQGAAAETEVYHRVSHITLMGAFAPALRFMAPVLRDVSEFVHRNSVPQARAA